jgi:hypothetical protein
MSHGTLNYRTAAVPVPAGQSRDPRQRQMGESKTSRLVIMLAGVEPLPVVPVPQQKAPASGRDMVLGADTVSLTTCIQFVDKCLSALVSRRAGDRIRHRSSRVRVLLTCGAVYSHFAPMVAPVAEGIREAGREVAVAPGPSLAGDLDRLGLPHLSLTSRRTRSGWPTSAPVSRRAGTKWIRRRSPRPVAGSWRTLRTGRPFAASNARFSACPVSTSWWPTSMHWLGHLVGTPRGGPVEDADAVLAGARTPSVAYMRDQTGRR